MSNLVVYIKAGDGNVVKNKTAHIDCRVKLDEWILKHRELNGRKSKKGLGIKLNQIDSHASPSHCDSQHGTNRFRTWVLFNPAGFSVYPSFLFDGDTRRQLTPWKAPPVLRHVTPERLTLWSRDKETRLSARNRNTARPFRFEIPHFGQSGRFAFKADPRNAVGHFWRRATSTDIRTAAERQRNVWKIHPRH